MENRCFHVTLRQARGGMIVLLAIGCSPLVNTSLQKSYSAREQNAPIVLCDVGGEVPASAQVLGSVTVEGPGLTSGRSFSDALKTARNAVNKAGGNSLSLTYHRNPSASSASGRHISGNILLIPDSLGFPDSQSSASTMCSVPVDAPGGPWKFGAFLNAGYSVITS